MNKIRNAREIVDQWGFGGWEPIIRDNGNGITSSHRIMGQNFLSETGKKFATVLKILQLSRRSTNFRKLVSTASIQSGKYDV